MKGDGRAGAAGPRGWTALLLLGTLAGCDALGSDGLVGVADRTASAMAGAAAASGDVAAPEIFHVTEPGLWDGRPSLGGVWVAHPDVTDPERVLIVNRDNGQEVTGALFRRERDLPGPALQVSSDAAEALGMLAGAPSTLEVTALRRQERPADPAPEPPAEPAPEAPGEAAPEPPAEAPAPAAEADPAAVEAVAEATAAIVAGAAVAGAAPAAVATTALDAAPGAAVATTALDAAPGAEAGPAPDQPFVQVGTFDVEANANEAALRLGAQGLPARVLAEGGAWRVLLGPALTQADAAALLRQAVAAGFADARPVSR